MPIAHCSYTADTFHTHTHTHLHHSNFSTSTYLTPRVALEPRKARGLRTVLSYQLRSSRILSDRVLFDCVFLMSIFLALQLQSQKSSNFAQSASSARISRHRCPNYLAPELIAKWHVPGIGIASLRAETWSLGMLAVELVTGTRAWVLWISL
jgi:hypothetical protein